MMFGEELLMNTCKSLVVRILENGNVLFVKDTV